MKKLLKIVIGALFYALHPEEIILGNPNKKIE